MGDRGRRNWKEEGIEEVEVSFILVSESESLSESLSESVEAPSIRAFTMRERPFSVDPAGMTTVGEMDEGICKAALLSPDTNVTIICLSSVVAIALRLRLGQVFKCWWRFGGGLVAGTEKMCGWILIFQGFYRVFFNPLPRHGGNFSTTD